MKELELLVCSDLHGSKTAADVVSNAAASGRYDAVVICGDFTTFGSTEYVRALLRRLKIRVLAVPGNCDVPDTVAVLEEFEASVHNLVVEFEGRKFFGFGGGLPTKSGMPFEVEEDLMERSLRAIAVHGGVMVTHVPAYGFNDHMRFGRMGGSQGVLRVVNEFKPVLALSGHIHEARGRALTAETVFVNPGPAKNGSYASVRLGDGVEVDFHDVHRQRTHPISF
ncbi:MAG: metallophosphoesterase family protein [Candidatus Thermoplasmatota archaeon]|nr:metallophosphoesterase family protein [Candidatus Thermoplasmatota archaeon]